MTPAEKDAAVLRVLRKAADPMPPILVADLAKANGAAMTDDSVLRALKRIGAVRHLGGRYSAPAEAQAAPEPKVAREALAPFVCVVCRKRVADYSGSRARGAGRACRACVA